MKYIAVKIKGELFIMNTADELGGLIDNDIPHEVVGDVCDDKEFLDRCNTDCPHYCRGTCPAVTMRIYGSLWHVVMR